MKVHEYAEKDEFVYKKERFVIEMKRTRREYNCEETEGKGGKSRKEVNVGKIKVKEWEKDVD